MNRGKQNLKISQVNILISVIVILMKVSYDNCNNIFLLPLFAVERTQTSHQLTWRLLIKKP